MEMKTLTEEEFLKAPKVVQYLYVFAVNNIPITSGIVKKTETEYPEYFIKS